jgi:hypothetical protein
MEVTLDPTVSEGHRFLLRWRYTSGCSASTAIPMGQLTPVPTGGAKSPPVLAVVTSHCGKLCPHRLQPCHPTD